MKAYIALACLAAVALAEPYGYYRGGYGGYRGYYRGKREAESEPKADAEPWLAYGGVYSPYTYGYAAYPTAYTTYSGLHYYGKRSADAEPEAKADPWYTTYGYGLHAPLAYGYGYTSAYSGYHYYGKRSADAEPKADAYYGYYGYARPYGGYYGYTRPYGGYYGYPRPYGYAYYG